MIIDDAFEDGVAVLPLVLGGAEGSTSLAADLFVLARRHGFPDDGTYLSAMRRATALDAARELNRDLESAIGALDERATVTDVLRVVSLHEALAGLVGVALDAKPASRLGELLLPVAGTPERAIERLRREDALFAGLMTIDGHARRIGDEVDDALQQARHAAMAQWSDRLAHRPLRRRVLRRMRRAARASRPIQAVRSWIGR